MRTEKDAPGRVKAEGSNKETRNDFSNLHRNLKDANREIHRDAELGETPKSNGAGSNGSDNSSADDHAARLRRLWDSADHAYTTFVPAHQDATTGQKIEGTYQTLQQAPVLEDYDRHLRGEVGLTVIPIKTDGACRWGAVDVDLSRGLSEALGDRNLHRELVRRVEQLGLPLVVDRSKSGGAHLVLHFAEPAPATEVRDLLTSWARALGLWHAGLEIFPKQTALDRDREPPEVGSALNLPYFGGSGGGTSLRRAFNAAGDAINLADYLDFAESRRVSLDAARAVELPDAPLEPPLVPDRVSDQNGSAPGGTGQGSSGTGPRSDRSRWGRQNYLHSFACSMRARDVTPETILEATLAENKNAGIEQHENFATEGPLDEREVEKIVTQALKYSPGNFYRSKGFECDDKGKPFQNQRNIRHALGLLGVKVSYDKFSQRRLVEGLDEFGPALDDDAVKRLWLMTDEKFYFRPGKDFFWTVIEDEARRNSFHPVLDYLDGLSWDGQPRLDTWLIQYAKAEDTTYTREVSRLVLLAAVRRVRQPGCKFDEMLILESPQGLDKSTALAVLAVNENWFSDDLPLNADGKRVIESLAGHWIIEAAELKGMRRGDIEHLKAFLSRRRDRARMSYDRLVSEAPRQCVIVGTTNSEQYLRDHTGNRRYWPVRVGQFDVQALARDRDQLWAEASTREARGESIRLDPAFYQEAEQVQEKRHIDDPWVDRLRHVLGDLDGKMRVEDAWTIVGKPSGQRTQVDNERLGEAIRALGFEHKQRRYGGEPEWSYVRGGKGCARIYVQRDTFGEVTASHMPHDTRAPF